MKQTCNLLVGVHETALKRQTLSLLTLVRARGLVNKVIKLD